MMQLFLSETSPFARKTNMFLQVSGLSNQCELVFTNPFEDSTLRLKNPLGKVPALLDNDQVLFESGLICEYLDEMHTGASLFKKGTADYFGIQKTHYLADGILSAAVSIVFENRRETEHSTYWLQRWHTAVETAITSIKIQDVSAVNAPHMGTLAVAAALGYLDFRLPETPWRLWNPELAEWFTQIEQQAWFTQTTPKA